ncbi:putative deoxyribose-phosphate aldolase isoform X2 [Apostichopus japonicus]|uniref:deoxyribose-phosphate aldolase n=1 Tax=Stichopus japonicus TaxID=307972 RepID=A0A2G8LFN6_STIJA|nr:putative deoxyribose-phosphate aldolase isoform X2 [Apostichopus japonicus]
MEGLFIPLKRETFAVATGFPAGQTHLKHRLVEISQAVDDGAAEIDVVINRAYALAGNWEGVYDEVKQFRAACGNAHLKVILATGELGSLTTVYKASMVAMMAGADFIKTSTGKEGVNAILPVGLVMVRAIRDYYKRTGNKDSCTWLALMKEELGNDWLTPKLFRIGASSLMGDIERQIFHNVTGRYAAHNELAMA